MDKLSRSDLYSLEQYADKRVDFRSSVLKHKLHRKVSIGSDLALYFEDRTTIQYQIQEMLRIERIFEPEAIQEELDTYNPLIPDGANLKASAMLEYEDVTERRERLVLLKGIEDQIWVRAGDFDKVFAIANEDLDRSNEEKTSAVHFLRFELSAPMIAALHDGAELSMGCDHPEYLEKVVVENETRESLLRDFSIQAAKLR